MNSRTFLSSAASAVAFGCVNRSFAWATQGTPSESLRVAFFTDLHCDTRPVIPAALSSAAAAIRTSSADLFLGGGDFITEGISSCPVSTLPRWEVYRQFQSELRMRVEPVIGNHDLVALRPESGCVAATNPREEFLRFFGLSDTYRTFVANGYRFFVVDSIRLGASEEALAYTGGLSSAHVTWLKNELERVSSGEPLVLVSHVPFRTEYFRNFEPPGYAVPKNLLVQNADEVLELFAGKNLVAVLQGHLHVNEIFRAAGTTFITGGAICGGWWQGPWHGTHRGFGILTLKPGSAEWKYQSYEPAPSISG